MSLQTQLTIDKSIQTSSQTVNNAVQQSQQLPSLIKDILELWNWIGGQNVVIGVLAIIVVLFVVKPEWANRISILVLSIFKPFKWARKETVLRSFEFNLKRKTEQLNKEFGTEIFSHGIKVKWADSNTTRESFIQNGKVVVKLDYHEDRHRTFALATMGYVHRGLLPVARQYIPEVILESASLLITRRLLSEYNVESLNFFVSDILAPLFKEKPDVKEKYNHLVALENRAMFAQIFIPEIYRLGNMLYPNPIDSKLITSEVELFINFLYTIATKEQNQDVPLNLKSKLFSIRIVLVARYEVISEHGLSPYRKRIVEGISEGYRHIYVLAFGSNERRLRKIIESFVDNTKVTSIVERVGRALDVNNYETKKCITFCLTIGEPVEKAEEEAS